MDQIQNNQRYYEIFFILLPICTVANAVKNRYASTAADILNMI